MFIGIVETVRDEGSWDGVSVYTTDDDNHEDREEFKADQDNRFLDVEFDFGEWVEALGFAADPDPKFEERGFQLVGMSMPKGKATSPRLTRR
jgi:hypothetical protein